MGILSDDFYKSLDTNQPQQPTQPVAPAPAAPVAQAPAPTPPTAPAPQPTQPAPALQMPNMDPAQAPMNTDSGEPVKIFGDANDATVASRKIAEQEFPTMSRLPRELLSTLGIRLPDENTWDKMGVLDQAATVVKGGVFALGRTLTNLPREIVKAPVRVMSTIVAPWERLARGEPIDWNSMEQGPRVNIPWLGEVPSFFQSYADAKATGMGPLAAMVSTAGQALGDATISASLGESMAGAFRPRAKLAPGEAFQRVTPARSTISSDGSFVKSSGSSAEYYTLPKTIAKEKYGGSASNTFLKITPATSDSVEVSVVQVRKGPVQRAVDFVKEKSGNITRNYQGDFGPEVKLDSRVVNTPPKTAGELPAAPVAAEAAGAEAAGAEATKPMIPPKALKGFENKPITSEQVGTLEKIGNYNGIEPGVRDAVVRTVTGKSVVGELTQKEYAEAAQTLATFNNAAKYAPDTAGINAFSRYVAPQRHWMRTYEENSGVPLYSEVYTPMEEATRVRDVFRTSLRNESRDIFGKYADPKYGEERRLVSAYMRGETEAITGNSTLTPETKAELTGIATKLRAVYDRIGPQLDVPTDIFLKDYQPRIQNIGGTFQLYKDGAEIPKELEFFGKFKRKGDLQGIQVDDALALFDMYVNSGSNRMFLNPSLQRIGALAEKLPTAIHNSVKSYVLEKLGYAGKSEEFLDSFVPALNRKLGLSLPPDAARQLTNLTLSTMYSGMLSSPATWFRQAFQYPLFGYARLGPKFVGQAIKAGLSKEGMAEAAQKGFLVSLGVPFGEELTKDTTLGGKALNTYKDVTQKFITPNSLADNGMRSITYHQSKMIWEDAIARYNKGEIAWPKLEEELDMKAFSKPDQDIIRQRLTSGDLDGAFNHYAREIVDETSFPYRKAASGRITYGLGGKLGSSLLQWPLEAGYTIKRWVTTGQWDKLIRFYAASSAINRTMKDTFGFDFTRSLFNRATGGIIPGSFLGPAQNPYSPFVKTALDTTNMLSAFFNQNSKDFNTYKDSIVRSLKSAMPGGVELQNISRFWKAYNAGDQLIKSGKADPNAPYPVLNDKGEVSYYDDFAGLFWGTLMGFPTEKKTNSSFLQTDMYNAQEDQSRAKQKIMELWQQEKYDEATKMMADTGVKIGPGDFDNYYVPLNIRTFQALPATLKAQFAPRVFPSNLSQ